MCTSNCQGHLHFVPDGEMGCFWPGGEEQLPPNPQCRSHHQPVVSDEPHHTHASWVRASGWPEGPCCVKSSGASHLSAQGHTPKDGDATGRSCDQPGAPWSMQT